MDRPQVTELLVNGESRSVQLRSGTTLLEVLRHQLRLKGAKEACGRGECGACTVLIEGMPVLACLTLAMRVRGSVTTVEGLSQEIADLRAAFADSGGFQCGYCTSGHLVHAAAILRAGLPADRVQAEQLVRHQLSGNICRCTGYTGIVEAVLTTAEYRRASSEKVRAADDLYRGPRSRN
jgi:aerobic-type carbon monoxide dehydrogenase small subunit (CoxS/CutS family)